MIDIDDFKIYNDTNGHPQGDELLKTIAKLIKENVRKIGMTARYGGDEFAVILIEANKEESLSLIGRIKEIIDEYDFPNQEKQPNKKITISTGIATFPDDATDAKNLLIKSDEFLYDSKKNFKKNK